MSAQLISHSPDLRRLRDEGYDISVVGGYLVVRHIPYVTETKQVALGVLVSSLDLAGDVTLAPTDHTVGFAGTPPCDRTGTSLTKLMNGIGPGTMGGETICCTFSNKIIDGGQMRPYRDYYEKVTTYVQKLAVEAVAIDASATAQPYNPIPADDVDSVFRYLDTGTSRSGTDELTARLVCRRVAIVGLGGTGSYVLDLVAKTPVELIDLYDGDRFLQHNAFRSPGAPSLDELRQRPMKVDYWRARYDPMRGGIDAHPYFLDASNAVELAGADFVFLTMDRSPAKKAIVQELERQGIAFVDTGMGVDIRPTGLGGILRTTTSTPDQRDHVWSQHRIPMSEGGVDEYSTNIQIADLNALNACLAVIRWKKHCGFYEDTEQERHTLYTIGGNDLINEDHA